MLILVDPNVTEILEITIEAKNLNVQSLTNEG